MVHTGMCFCVRLDTQCEIAPAVSDGNLAKSTRPARQHVVYEHPRDVDTDTILDQFQCRSSKALLSLQ